MRLMTVMMIPSLSQHSRKLWIHTRTQGGSYTISLRTIDKSLYQSYEKRMVVSNGSWLNLSISQFGFTPGALPHLSKSVIPCI